MSASMDMIEEMSKQFAKPQPQPKPLWRDLEDDVHKDPPPRENKHTCPGPWCTLACAANRWIPEPQPQPAHQPEPGDVYRDSRGDEHVVWFLRDCGIEVHFTDGVWTTIDNIMDLKSYAYVRHDSTEPQPQQGADGQVLHEGEKCRWCGSDTERPVCPVNNGRRCSMTMMRYYAPPAPRPMPRAQSDREAHLLASLEAAELHIAMMTEREHERETLIAQLIQASGALHEGVLVKRVRELAQPPLPLRWPDARGQLDSILERLIAAARHPEYPDGDPPVVEEARSYLDRMRRTAYEVLAPSAKRSCT